MEEQLIIETIVKSVQDGLITINQVPEVYREQVQALLEE